MNKMPRITLAPRTLVVLDYTTGDLMTFYEQEWDTADYKDAEDFLTKKGYGIGQINYMITDKLWA